MSSKAIRDRLGQVSLENFQPRDRIADFPTQKEISIDECLKDAPVDHEQQRALCEIAKTLRPFDGPLSKDEGLAMYLYSCIWEPSSKSLYKLVNDALRNTDRSICQRYLPFIILMNNSIAKTLTNVEQTLWRGVSHDLYDHYYDQIGRSIVFWGYTSLVPDLATLEMYVKGPHRTFFAVRTHSAANLSAYSAFPTEMEFLVAAGTQFRVLNVSRASDGITVISLEEEKNLFDRKLLAQAVEVAEEEDDMAEVEEELYKISKKLLDPDVLYMQGLQFEFGTGVPKDEIKALERYQRAAEHDHPGALAQLGFFYDYGKANLPVDLDQALYYYKSSVSHGNSDGMFYLGSVYHLGRPGIPKKEVEATRLYRLAADQGHAYAQCCLGLFYERGLGGVLRDVDEARRFYSLAADQGHELAARWLRSSGT